MPRRDDHPDVRIDQLTLRLPAEAADLGEAIAHEVGRRLASVGAAGVVALGAVDARVVLAAGASRSDLVAAVADAVVRSVEKAHA